MFKFIHAQHLQMDGGGLSYLKRSKMLRDVVRRYLSTITDISK